jgi:hypothetical protein
LGGLGLQLYPSSLENTATPNIDKTFLRKLKLVGLANNYIWSIFYKKERIINGEISGYLLLGDYPHLSINFPDSNKYNYSLNSIDAEVYNQKIIQTKFLMHNAQIIKDENILIEDEAFYVNLDYNFGGIILPDKFRLYFEENIFMNKDLCYKSKVSRIFKDIFYYCNNDDNTINYLKRIFPIIKLENKLLNSSFIININNLLNIKGNYIYVLLIFEETNYWTLGIPFLKEYQFSINEDAKKIYYYKKIEINESQKSEKKEKYNIYIIFNFFISGFLFLSGLNIGIYQYYKGTRKKRKNELDENFEYVINDEDNIKIIN